MPSSAKPGVIARAYLWYMLLVPQGATVAALATYRGPSGGTINLFLWLAGAVAVAVYAAFVTTYTTLPRARWRAAVALVDGPIFLIAAIASLHGWRVLDLTAWFFLVESLSLYAGILIVALTTDLDAMERNASIGIMVVCMGVVGLMVGWSIWPRVFASGRALALFVLDFAASTIGVVMVANRREPARSGDQSFVPVLVTILLWMAALVVGAIGRVNGWFH